MANEIKLQTSPVEADLTVKAVIRDANGLAWDTVSTAFVTFVDANINRYGILMNEQGTSSGFYVGSFPVDVMDAGTYATVVYKQAAGTLSVSDTVLGEGDLIWYGSTDQLTLGTTDLITLAYYKTAIGLTSSTSDDRLNAMITAASKAITRYCRKRFLTETYTDYYNGRNFSGSNDYYGGSCWSWSLLLKRFPIISLTSITLYPHDSTMTEVIAGTEFIVDNNTGDIRLKTTSTATSLFPAGFQTVKAIYQAGYATVPEDIQNACAMMVKNWFTTSNRNSTVASEKIGDYAYTNITPANLLAGANAVMTNEIKQILDLHRDYVV